MIIWFGLILITGGLGWALFGLSAWFMVGALADLSIAAGLILMLPILLVYPRKGKTEVEKAFARSCQIMREAGVKDPERIISCEVPPDFDEHGIPYLK